MVNPRALHQEIDRVLQQHNLQLMTRTDFIDEPLPWRIVERGRQVRIDTAKRLPQVYFGRNAPL
ncbi:hypothetical protein [Hymenobacter volaticus]|uniref:Uncharacterized protein n=1 Tax=Hymenobacter volaticus TaxID=2932254 RepID=A0ABY4GDT6_9BACT|nr:hypothetical protein [Hymenobacter volaticus]UOQ69085.1 hypothetical protein MUN86_26650 [Hymenobacter volaticus]